MSRLAILGAGGHGKVIADAALSSEWNEVIFFDDAYPEVQAVEHWSVAGNTDDLLNQLNQFDGIIVAIGSNEIRLKKINQLKDHKAEVVSVIHPKAVVSPYSSIAEGTVIMAGAVINAFANINTGCIINTNAVIEHDCYLGEGTHVCPGSSIAGDVSIGAKSFIGIGSCIKQGLEIGEKVVLGAGSVVVKNLHQSGTYIGVPASRYSD